MNSKIFPAILAAFASLVLGGCVGDLLVPREDPTQFYVINSESNVEKIDGMKDVPLNVSLVRIPSYMSRNQIVTSLGGGARIEISDIHRWPEIPLDSFTRVISANIARITESDEIYTYPSLALGTGAPELRVNILECMGEIGGELVFSARWELVKNDTSKDIRRKTSIFEVKTSAGDDYDEYVKAIEKAIYELSLDIAKGLKEFK